MNLNNTDNSSSASNNNIDEDIIKQFKIIMILILIVLLIFLGFFIYNLIKCYLPKWRRQYQLKEENDGIPAEILSSNINNKRDIELN
jgi:hypothetical protein